MPVPRTYFFTTALATHLQDAYGHRNIPDSYSEEEADKLSNDRKIWSERARQIREDLNRSGIQDPKLVIFDEQVTHKARTSGEINIAFGQQLPLYALMSEMSQREQERLGRKIRIGAKGVIFISHYFKEGVGVIKDRNKATLHSKRSPSSSRKEIVELREMMSQIGQRIASDLRLESSPDVGH